MSLFEKQPVSVKQNFEPDAGIILYPGDVNEFIQTIPDNSVNLIITSPPYNIGKEYEKQVSIAQYLETQNIIIRQLHRILKDDGSICWQVGNYVKDGEVWPLDIFYYDIFKKLGMFLRNRMIWHFGHGLHCKNRFSGRYETVLWFSKSREYVFNLDPVRVPSKYPGKKHYKGDKKGEFSGNPNGKNPSDVWEFLRNEWETAFWEIPNVKSNHCEKTDHPCQFPVELVERCVLALTNEGDRVFDPYAGVGSSLVAALKNNRRAMGCEKEAEYIRIAHERIQALSDGTLAVRPLGQPVHKPSGKEKVAQIPLEWKNR